MLRRRRNASACRGPRPSRLLRGKFGHGWDDGWGARIRTWDHGTKTRCLTAWPRPIRSRTRILPWSSHRGRAQERAQRDHGESTTATIVTITSAQRPGTSTTSHCEKAAIHASCATSALAALPRGVERDGADASTTTTHQGIPPASDDDPLDRRDRQRDPVPVVTQPAPRRASRRARSRGRSSSSAQPYQPGVANRSARSAYRRPGAPRPRRVEEEPVDGRAGPADVGAKRPERLELRARAPTRRDRSAAAPPGPRRRDACEGVEQRAAALLVARPPVSLVEGPVHGRRRFLTAPSGRTSRTEKSCGSSSCVSFVPSPIPSCGPSSEEERDVRTERGGELPQPSAASGAGSVALARRRAVAASELPPPRPAATGMRLVMRRVPQRLDPCLGGQPLERAPTIVSSANPSTSRRSTARAATRSASATRW